MNYSGETIRCAFPGKSPVMPRVLVVDDNTDVADMLSSMLNTEAMETRVAYTGAHALDLAWTWSPDVILLDLSMPGLDGFDVVRRLRSDEEFEHTSIIAISDRDYSRAQAKGQGFTDFIRKPGNRDAIVDLIFRHWRNGG